MKIKSLIFEVWFLAVFLNSSSNTQTSGVCCLLIATVSVSVVSSGLSRFLVSNDFFPQTLQNFRQMTWNIPQQAPSFPAQLLGRIGARIPTSLWMMLGESFGSQVIGGLLIMVDQSNIHIWVFPKMVVPNNHGFSY